MSPYRSPAPRDLESSSPKPRPHSNLFVDDVVATLFIVLLALFILAALAAFGPE